MRKAFSILLTIALVLTSADLTVFAQGSGAMIEDGSRIEALADEQENGTDATDPEESQEAGTEEEKSQESESESGEPEESEEAGTENEETAEETTEEEQTQEQESLTEEVHQEESVDESQEASMETEEEIEAEEWVMEGELPLSGAVSMYAGTATTPMFVGDTKTFSYQGVDLNGGFSVTSYSWSASGDSVRLSGKTYSSCQVEALATGKSTLYFSCATSRSYYIYEDVQRTKKKWITQTQNYSWTWVINVSNKYEVSFDPNGGSVSSSGITVGYGDGFTYGALPVPTRTGYVFDGWFTDKEAGSQVTSDSTVGINRNHTLYAHWVPEHSYTIHFDGNGNTGGQMEDMRCAYGQSYQLPANAFTKSGNRFVGWSKDPDGVGALYANKSYVRNLSKEDEVITFYAQWSDKNVASGAIDGTNVTWAIDPEGTLIISGSGAIPDATVNIRDIQWWRYYPKDVKAIIVEEGITGIGSYAFDSMTQAETVEILGNVTNISKWAFYNCASLQSIQLPDSLRTIGDSAFADCFSLKTLELPDSVTYIGDYVFSYAGIQQIKLPRSLTSIGVDAFRNSILKYITVDEENTSFADVDGVLFNYEKTKLIYCPGGRGDTYVIPEGVTDLGNAFSGVTFGVKKLIVPASVKKLGANCFYDNQTIKEIYFRGAPPELGKTLIMEGFSGTSLTFYKVKATIYYPKAYQASWTSAMNTYNNAYFLDGKPELTWKLLNLHSSIEDCSITVDDSEQYEYDGTEKEPSVHVEDEGVILQEGTDYTLDYRNNINAGTAVVIVKGTGSYSGEKEAAFPIYKTQQYLTVNILSQSLMALESMALEGVSGIGTITYESSDPEIAEVSEDGVIIGKKLGTVTITVTASGDANYEEDEEVLEITVEHNPALPPTELLAEKETLDCHVGSGISLEDLKVSVSYDDGYSEEVTDYVTNVSDIDTSTQGEKELTVSYTENGSTLDTRLTITVLPHIAGEPVHENVRPGSYEEVVYCAVCHAELSRETKEGSLDIVKEGLWFLPIADQTYTGSALKPVVEVYYGSTLLKEKTDYTVTYKNNKNANDASAATSAPTITIKGKGSYGGKEEVLFRILPKNLADGDMDISFADAYSYKAGSQPKLSLTVKYGKQTLKKDRDYTLSYKNSAGQTVTDISAEGSYTLVVAGKDNYTGQRELPFEVTNKTPVSGFKVSKIASCAYDGTPKEPTVTLKDGKNDLQRGVDYELSYENNIEVGKAAVVIKGKGKYTGSRRVYFNITGTSIGKAKITGWQASVEYTGAPILQNVQLTVKTKTEGGTVEKTLREGTDYEVSFQNNTNAGKAVMILTGKGGYTGTVKKTFTIKAYDLKNDGASKIRISGTAIKVPYAKGGAKPDVEIYYGGKKLVLGTDYTLSYSNNKAVTKESTAKLPVIHITGKGNYKGKLVNAKTFSIESQSLRAVRGSADDVVYKNKAGNFKSVPTLVDLDGKKLAAGKDYSKTYRYYYVNQTVLADGTVRQSGEEANDKDIVPADTEMEVTVFVPEDSGSGNYREDTQIRYHITAKSLKGAKVKVLTNFEYTGDEVRLTRKDLQITPKGESQATDSYVILEDTYQNNVKKGTASVQIRGTGNYGGIVTVKYKIGAHQFKFLWF